MRIGGIILARMASERLPGKPLRLIGRKPMIEQIIERSRAAGLETVLATTQNASDDELAEFVQTLDVPVYKGATEPVLRRLADCALVWGFDHVARLSGDNPFYDVELLKRLTAFYVRHQPLDVGGVRRRDRNIDITVTWTSTTMLLDAAERFKWLAEYFGAERDTLRRAILRTNTPHWNPPGLRLTVDEPRDLAFANELALRLEDRGLFGIEDILDIVTREPWLLGINCGVAQRAPEYEDTEFERAVAAWEAEAVEE